MAQPKNSLVRFTEDEVVAALQMASDAVVAEVQDIIESPEKTAGEKVKLVKKKLNLRLLPLAPLKRQRPGSSRLPEADRTAQTWRTVDLIRQKVSSELQRRAEESNPALAVVVSGFERGEQGLGVFNSAEPPLKTSSPARVAIEPITVKSARRRGHRRGRRRRPGEQFFSGMEPPAKK